MNKPLAVGIGLLLLVFLLLFSMTYSVRFHEVAIRKTFGQSDADGIITEPGLHFKLPIFADQVTRLDTRMQLLESPLETIPTADGQQVVARVFLLWQVDTEGDGPQLFETRFRGVEYANAALNERFRTAIAAGIAQFRFHELLGAQSRLTDAEQAIMDELAALRNEGVRPVTVGISQVMLPARTSRAVLERMEATRERLAQAERSKGQAEAERIDSESRTMAEKILAFARQRAEEIRAVGNEEAAKYIQQMSEDEDLAIFLVYLDALEASLSERTTMVLPADMAPWHFMRLSSPVDARGIPHPTEALAQAADERRRLADATAAGNPGSSDEEDRDREDEAAVDDQSRVEKGQ